MSTAKLSYKLYRWIGESGGYQIGRKVLCPANRETTHGLRVLMRCDFGWLYWVNYQDIEEHDTTYREREKEAEGAN